MRTASTSRSSDAILARVRASARLLADWTERLWLEGQTSSEQGLAILPGEVRRILLDPETAAERFHLFLAEEEPARLAQAAAAAEAALAEDEFWRWMTQLFALNSWEQDLLALCVAIELDPRLGRVLAYLADDTRAVLPTASMAAALFGWKTQLPVPMSGLLRWRLAHPTPVDAALRATTYWLADEAVALSVTAERWMEPSLRDCTRSIPADEALELPCLYPELLAQMLTELPGPPGDGNQPRPDVVLTGPEGSGRETLAAQFAASIGSQLLSVRSSSLLASVGANESKGEALRRAVRLAHATGSVLYWRDAEAIPATEWPEWNAGRLPAFRGAHSALGAATHSYVLPPLPTAQRLQLWALQSDAPPPAIVQTQRLTAGEILLVAKAAPLTTVHMALRQAAQAHSDLIQPLACPYTWDDLVVTPNLLRLLKDFEAQVLLRWEVYEKWGFARLTHMGKGISALFGGPSGTGKTMSAQVLARSLGLDLYRVDLAGVVNKYIGETEKRLREVFDICERSGALLFFDEADALFGNRMQVKDSHDRFANIEIDYLLQRIEQFDGIAILATNRKNDLDTAFLRRLRFVVDFINPGKLEQRILWEKSLLPHSPEGECITARIDFNLLAERMELNGAQIKSIALGAAFLARHAGTRIGMEHIELAAQREYAKQGQMLRATLTTAATN